MLHLAGNVGFLGMLDCSRAWRPKNLHLYGPVIEKRRRWQEMGVLHGSSIGLSAPLFWGPTAKSALRFKISTPSEVISTSSKSRPDSVPCCPFWYGSREAAPHASRLSHMRAGFTGAALQQTYFRARRHPAARASSSEQNHRSPLLCVIRVL